MLINLFLKKFSKNYTVLLAHDFSESIMTQSGFYFWFPDNIYAYILRRILYRSNLFANRFINLQYQKT